MVKKYTIMALVFFCNSAMAGGMPEQEEAFISIVQKAQIASSDAQNEMQLGGIKTNRDDTICTTLKKRKVSDWIGHVSDIGANSDGKGVISIEIANGVEIKTWNNSISDYADHTLIDPRSSLFQTASQLSSGDTVKFSGSFFKGVNECINEMSMGLSGGISDPEFLFKFSKLEKL